MNSNHVGLVYKSINQIKFIKMKVLVATEKPFAKVAVDGIRPTSSLIRVKTKIFNGLHFLLGTTNIFILC